MFKEIILDNEEVANEAEHSGNVGIGATIKFNRLVDWMNSVNASSNAKFLKCIINESSGVSVHNIVDIMISENVEYKGNKYDQAVKVAFKEDATGNAMTIADVVKTFTKISNKCKKLKKNTEDIEVFACSPKEKLSRFCWFYDDDQQVACIVKNMNPSMAKKWLAENQDTINKLATSDETVEKIEIGSKKDKKDNKKK